MSKASRVQELRHRIFRKETDYLDISNYYKPIRDSSVIDVDKLSLVYEKYTLDLIDAIGWSYKIKVGDYIKITYKEGLLKKLDVETEPQCELRLIQTRDNGIILLDSDYPFNIDAFLLMKEHLADEEGISVDIEMTTKTVVVMLEKL